MKKWKLDYHIPKSMVNAFLNCYTGGKQRPAFFDIPNTYPELTSLTTNFETIRGELDHVLKVQPDLPEYHDVDPGERAISAASAQKWRVFMLYILGNKPQTNRALCPETSRLLDG